MVEAQANGLKCIVSTGVSEEAKLINTTRFISLDDEQSWVEEINSDLPTFEERIYANKEVLKAGYSIKQSYEEFTRIAIRYQGN